jgi:serine phosphatase RsbU (regulator of sigma subunit)
MAAVMMSVAAINSLRNSRREGSGLEASYLAAGEVIEEQFGVSCYVTGQLASLHGDTGELSWVNAGHPLPLLVRDGSHIGELECRPSLPMGLGGSVKEIASVSLQPGDRVLFYSDGVSESRGPTGDQFGVGRLADFVVRSTLDGAVPQRPFVAFPC